MGRRLAAVAALALALGLAGCAPADVDAGAGAYGRAGAATAQPKPSSPSQESRYVSQPATGAVHQDGDTIVLGDGTPASCTSAALARAVRSGGHISFDCGPEPHTIVVTETLYTCNTDTCAHPWQGGEPVTVMELDGGGLITLSGGGARQIFYSNTCEESFGWLSSSCQNETTPHIIFRNITLADGNASVPPPAWDTLPGGGGGGAIGMRGGRLSVVNATFTDNRCMVAHSDAGGGAIRATGMRATVRIIDSEFDNNRCANGGAISSLHASLDIRGTDITNSRATGSGASSGSGGNGGAVYFDGTDDTVTITGSTLSGNYAPEGGPGVFYVSNNRAGHLTIEDSQIVDNTGQRFYTSPYRDIFYLGRQTRPTVINSTVE